MCVSAKAADFRGTRILINYTVHPILGRPILVLGYQNTAINYADGPNAMLLHLPAKPMTRENFLDTASAPNFMKDMEEVLTPRDRGFSDERRLKGFDLGLVEVFEHGIYTVVLADDASLIPDALIQVPANKRPSISAELCSFYSKSYPGCPVALCCFNNRDTATATPLLLWYEPRNPALLTAPGIDCHTGGIPDLGAPVDVDHWLFAASYRKPHLGVKVPYRDRIDVGIRQFIPDNVVGTQFTGRMRNGDFAIQRSLLESSTGSSSEFGQQLVQRVGPHDLGI
jgi:hypothetical protein